MRHRLAFRKLGMETAHREATRRSIVCALFRHERVVTTVMRAKDFRPWAEGMIELAKGRPDRKRKITKLHAFRQLVSSLQDVDIVRKLVKEIAPRFADRRGGYTRILRLGGSRWTGKKKVQGKWAGWRLGDQTPRAIFELVIRNEEEAPAPAADAKAEAKGGAKKEKPVKAKAPKKEKAAAGKA